MKKLTVKEILELTSEELENMMTDIQKEKMFDILCYNQESDKYNAFLTFLQDGAKQSDLEEDEEYITIDEYLEYLEEMI